MREACVVLLKEGSDMDMFKEGRDVSGVCSGCFATSNGLTELRIRASESLSLSVREAHDVYVCLNSNGDPGVTSNFELR